MKQGRAFRPVHAQVLAWRHGWSLPLGAVATVLALLAYQLVYVPLRSELVGVSTELAQTAAARPSREPVARPVTEDQQLASLRAVLRANADASTVLGRLGALAAAEQIRLSQGEYQQQLHARTQLLQLQVTQPVKATYPQVRRYIHAVLLDMPHASLDQVSARRDNVGQAQLEVRLRWSFWIHAPQAGAAAEVRP